MSFILGKILNSLTYVLFKVLEEFLKIISNKQKKRGIDHLKMDHNNQQQQWNFNSNHNQQEWDAIPIDTQNVYSV